MSGDQNQKRDAGKGDPLMMEEDLALALEAVCACMEYGKAKYGSRGGWKAVDMARYKSAEARHRRERMKHGDLSRDGESGLPHIQHEIVDALFQLQTLIEKNPDINFTAFNPPPGTVSAVEPKASTNTPTQLSGRRPKGSRCLSPLQIKQVKRMREAGASGIKIAAAFAVSDATIYRILGSTY